MGFLDKAKQTLNQGKEKLDDLQADRKADQLLAELGKWYYAGRTRANTDAAGHIERLVAELRAHEAEHGELGSKATPAPDVAAPDVAAPADVPPAPAAPVTDGPPPPVTSGPPPPPE